MHIGIFIYENAEVLDFAGPFEVFAKAASLLPPEEYMQVSLIAQQLEPICARAGFTVTPHACIDDHAALDALIVPGGLHHEEMRKARVMDWLKQQARCTGIMASVCTGAFLLAQAGVLTAQRVTTHWDDIAELRRLFPELTVLENTRWVDEGSIVTSAGISAGIDMSLHLLERLKGRELALATARRMEYEWRT